MSDLQGDGGRDRLRRYSLAAARSSGSQINKREPAAHQKSALSKLEQWYSSTSLGERGAILVLPTGGGKTYTAVHFLCRHALSNGFKVLWLAHTHHLLEQARSNFDDLVQVIAEPKAELTLRLVSGASNHSPIHEIQAEDDVVIASLPAVAKAVKVQHESIERFVRAASGKLVVVFDEAHHSPAPSYRRLLQEVRSQCPSLFLLGLTATPTYSDEAKRGWLARLFPQGIIHQETPHRLMAAGILARPCFEEARTQFQAEFSETEYARWLGSNRDIPEEIISYLAANRSRNEYIAGYYADRREKFGKTIIFADRWTQCVAICELLGTRGIRADAVYSHVAGSHGTPEDRNRRTPGQNAQILEQFRRGELDVLLNVRMLTEGTDVPKVQTVFLTRQTTSQILLTQMVGRALRGPEFGGTNDAYIVAFIDDWRQRINWAAYDQIGVGPADDGVSEYGKRPPLQLISIDLIRRLARQMDSGVTVNSAPFLEFLPAGWYRVEFDSQVGSADDVESTRQLVMVFDRDKPQFDALMKALRSEDLSNLEDPAVTLARENPRLLAWHREFFGQSHDDLGVASLNDVFLIARHMAQNDREPPPFFSFDSRDNHNLDSVAASYIHQDLGPRAINDALRAEFTRHDRFWRAIFPNFERFKSQYDCCLNRIVNAHEHSTPVAEFRPGLFERAEPLPDREPGNEVKDEVKRRDGNRCLNCGSRNSRSLTIDHVAAWYAGGQSNPENLQTLCNACNSAKGVAKISFRNHHTTLTAPPGGMPDLAFPSIERARDAAEWEMFLRRSINLFYRCCAVDSVEIGERGERRQHWRVRLFSGNNPEWIRPHLGELASRIRSYRTEAAIAASPSEITVNEPPRERIVTVHGFWRTGRL